MGGHSNNNYKTMSGSQSSVIDYYSNPNLASNSSSTHVMTTFESAKPGAVSSSNEKDVIISGLNKSLSELRFEYDYLTLKCKKLESELDSEKQHVKQLEEALVKPAGTTLVSDAGFLKAKIKDLELSLEKELQINRQLADHVSELSRSQEALMSAERLGSAFGDQPELLSMIQRSLVSKERLLQNYLEKDQLHRNRISKLDDSIKYLQELNTRLEEQKNYFELKVKDLERKGQSATRIKKSPSNESVSDSEEYSSPSRRRRNTTTSSSSKTLLATIASAKTSTEEKSTQTFKAIIASGKETAKAAGIVSALASESHQQEKTKAQHRISALEVELARSVRSVEDMQVRFETLFRQWNATEVALKQRDAEYVKLSSEYEQVRVMLSQREGYLANESGKFELALTEKNSLIQSLESQLRATEKQLSTDKDGLGFEINKMLHVLESIHSIINAYLVSQKRDGLLQFNQFKADDSPERIKDNISMMLQVIFDTYKSDIDSVTRSNENLRTMVDEIKLSGQKQLDSKDDEISTLKKSLETLEKEISASRNQWIKEHEHYENQTAGLNAHSRDLVAQIDGQSHIIESLEREKAALAQTIEENGKKYGRGLEELRRENALMEFKYTETQQGLDDMVQRYNSINQNLVETNLRFQELRREYEMAQSDFELARSQMDSERVDFARIKLQLAREKEDLQEQVKKARQMAKDAEDHSSSLLSQMNKKATEFVDETTQKITQQEVKYHNSLKSNHEKAMEQERLNFQKRLSDLKSEKESEIQQLANQLAALRDEKETLQKSLLGQVEALQADLKLMTSDRDGLNSDRQSLLVALESMKLERQSFANALEDAKAKESDLADKVALKEKELSLISQEMSSLKKDYSLQLQSKDQEYASCREKYDQDALQLKQKSEQELAALKQRYDTEVQGLMAKKGQELLELGKKHEEMIAADRRQFQEKIESDRKKYNSHLDAERRRLVQQLENEKKNASVNVENLNKKHVETLTGAREELEKAKNEIDSLKDKLQQLNISKEANELEGKLKASYQEEDYSLKISKLKEELSTTKAALSRKVEELTISCQELEEVTAKSRHFEQQVDELRIDFENQLSELSARLDQTTSFYTEQVDSLKDTLKKEREEHFRNTVESKSMYEKYAAQAKDEMVQLNEKLKLKRSENKELEDKIRMLQEEVESYYKKNKEGSEALAEERKKSLELEQKIQLINEAQANELSLKSAQIKELEMCVVNLQQQDVGEDAARKDQQFEAFIQVIRDQHEAELCKMSAEKSEVDSQLCQMKEEAEAQASVQMGLEAKVQEMENEKLQLTGLIAEKDAKMTAAQKDWSNQFNLMQVNFQALEETRKSDLEKLQKHSEEILNKEKATFDAEKKRLADQFAKDQQNLAMKHVEEEEKIGIQLQEQFADIIQLKDAVDEKERELGEKRSIVLANEQEISSLKNQIHELSKALEEKKAESFKSMSEKEREYEKQKSQLSDLVKKLTKESQKLAKINEALEGKNSQMEADLLESQKSFQDLNSSHAISIQGMTEKITVLKEKHDLIVSEYEGKIRQLEEEAVIANGELQEQVYSKIDEANEIKAQAEKDKVSLEGKIGELSSSLEDHVKRINDFTARESFHLQKIQDLEASLSTSQKEYLASLEAKRLEHESSMERQVLELSSKIATLEQENSNINDEFGKSVDGLMGQIRGLHTLRDKLMAEVHDLQDNLTQFEEENIKLKNDRNDDREAFVSQFEKMKTLFLEAKREADSLAKDNRQLLIEMDEIEKDSEAYWEAKKNEALAMADDRAQELLDKLKSSKQKYLDSEKERLSLKENLRAFEAEVAKDGQELKIRIDDLTAAFEEKKKTLETQVQNSQSRISELEGTLDREKAQFRKERQSLVSTQKTLEDTLASLKNEHASLVQTLTVQYEGKINELQNERDFVTDFQKSLSNSQGELMRQLQQTKDEFYKLKQESELKIISLEAQNQSQQDEIGTLLVQLKETSDSLDNCDQKLVKAQKDLKALKTELSQVKNDAELRLSSTIESYQQEMKQAEAETGLKVDSLVGQIESLKESLATSGNEQVEAEKTISDLRDQLINERVQAKGEHEEAMERLKQQHTIVMEKISKQLDQVAEEKTELGDKCQILEIHVKEIEDYYKQAASEENESRIQLSRAIRRLKRRVDEKVGEVVGAGASANSTASSPTASSKDPMSLIALLDQAIQSLTQAADDKLARELSNLKSEMQAVIQKKSKELKGTLKSLQIIQTESVANLDKVRELENHCDYLKAEMESVRAVAAKTEDDLKTMHHEKLERLTKEHESRLDSLTFKISQSEESRVGVEAQLTATLTRLGETEKSMALESNRQKSIIEGMVQQFKDQQNNITNLRSQEIQQFQSKIHELRLDLESRESDLAKEQLRANALESELSKQRTKLEELANDLAKEKAKSDSAALLEKEAMRSQSLQAQLTLMERQQHEFASQIKSLTQQLEQERLHHNHRLQEAIYSLKTQDSTLLEQKIKEIHKYSNALSDYKHKYHDCQRALQDSQALVEDLQVKISAKSSEPAKQAASPKISADLAKIKKLNSELNIQVMKLQSQNAELANRLRRLSQEEYNLVQNLISDVESSVNERKGARLTIQRLESLFESIPMLETRIQSISDLANLKQQMVSLDSFDESIQRGLESILSHNESIVQAVEAVGTFPKLVGQESGERLMVMSLLQTIQSSWPHLMVDNGDTNQSFESLISAIESSLSAIAQESSSALMEREELQSKLSDRTSAVNQLKQHIRQIGKKLDESHAKEKSLRHEIKKLDRDLDIMQEQAKTQKEQQQRPALIPPAIVPATQSDIGNIYTALRTEYLSSIRVIQAIVNTSVQQGILSSSVQVSLENAIKCLESREKVSSSELVDLLTATAKVFQSVIMMCHSKLKK